MKIAGHSVGTDVHTEPTLQAAPASDASNGSDRERTEQVQMTCVSVG